MPKVVLFNQSGSQVGDLELSDSVFGIEPNTHVLHEAVLMQQASKRQGTHKVKTRGEVSGGGKKPWRQKGTGRARQGTIRAPQWVGGGTVFGPTPRSYSYKLPKKVRRLALRSAYSSKVQEGNLLAVEDFSMDAPKTKEVVNFLKAVDVNESAIIITAQKEENVVLSSNNLPNVQTLTFDQVSVLDLLTHDKVIVTKNAAEKVGEVLS
ncbi:50S ribosomal protein L4 [Salimicrobium flavidum]|uniref:Large ribosomal subunit protein uL4 n=1 Tax=Salimicrobium flavidum TaxID=570947 RepID=A0A1N7KIK9_9BACI|nr:50S ribosomal protein L4 [Salimicrobium flavidum]SIS61397.1 LSU ribosomal protein L4P [Salimicrobium flavidum]